MSSIRIDILSQMRYLENDEVLIFRTMPNNNNKQFFIVASVPRTYNTFNVCVFNGLEDSHTIYENCNIVISSIDGETLNNHIQFLNQSLNPNQDYFEAKITERHGTFDSPTIVKTNMPIDMKSVKVLRGKSFEEIIEEVIEIRKNQMLKKQTNAEISKQYELIEKGMQSLIDVELYVSTKSVIHREENSRTDSFYSYDSQTTKEKRGLEQLIDVFNSCITHYGFKESNKALEIFKADQSFLYKALKDRNNEQIQETLSCNKRIATELGRRYIEFLKYLINNDINFLEDDFRYIVTYKKYGYGNDRDYVLTVSEPVIKAGAGIRAYIIKVLSEQDSIEFDNEVSNILKQICKKNNKSK